MVGGGDYDADGARCIQRLVQAGEAAHTQFCCHLSRALWLEVVDAHQFRAGNVLEFERVIPPVLADADHGDGNRIV